MLCSTSRPSSAIKDTDTSAGNASANKVVCDIISFADMSDPITVDLVCQKGFTIKNNGNDVDAKAVRYRGGEELDADGAAYTYTWKLWNSAGTSVVKTYTGKSITVAKTNVTGKGVLMCEVSKITTHTHIFLASAVGKNVHLPSFFT